MRHGVSSARLGHVRPLALLLGTCLALSGCRGEQAPKPSPAAPTPRATATPTPAPEPDPFERYLRADIPVADGFDFPVGDADGRGSYVDASTGRSHDGWYVATAFGEEYSLGIHPGEDWNGTGGSNTDQGQPVHAVAAGRVTYAAASGPLWGNIAIVRHLFFENHERREIHSVYVHLAGLHVRAGQDVRRRQLIGTIGRDPDGRYTAHLHLELRRDGTLAPTYWPSSNGMDQDWVREHYEAPREFIRARRHLPMPGAEPVMAVVDSSLRRMRLYEAGRAVGDYEVGFGQSAGRKRLAGDNKTPRGMYFVVQKSRGPFDGPYGDFYGGHWIKLNYPNRHDAAWGREHGLLNAAQAASISADWEARRLTWQGSPLGNGIGFHGWIRDWELEGPRLLSWGCVVMRNADIRTVYDRLPLGTMVVLR